MPTRSPGWSYTVLMTPVGRIDTSHRLRHVILDEEVPRFVRSPRPGARWKRPTLDLRHRGQEGSDRSLGVSRRRSRSRRWRRIDSPHHQTRRDLTRTGCPCRRGRCRSGITSAASVSEDAVVDEVLTGDAHDLTDRGRGRRAPIHSRCRGDHRNRQRHRDATTPHANTPHLSAPPHQRPRLSASDHFARPRQGSAVRIITRSRQVG